MQLRLGGAVLATALFALSAAPAAMAAREPLNAYRVADTAANKSKLALEGFDMVEADRGSYLEIFGTAKQAAAPKPAAATVDGAGSASEPAPRRRRSRSSARG